MEYDLTELKALFSECSKGIAAVGDETRQLIVLVLMAGPADGMRVGAITERTNLSRPAVSHHLKVLRDAEIVSMSKVGTMNYYYLNPDRKTILSMLHLCEGIIEIMDECQYMPDERNRIV